MPLFEIERLCAGYGGRDVLRGVSLSLEAGETAALLGLNGSGKSTLLRAAAGLLRPGAGRVSLEGEDMLRANERSRALRCAYIPQRSRMDDGLTALEVTLMGANARTPLMGSYSRVQKRQALSCLAQLGAQEWADRQVGTLSQGQRQLVIFARAMMQRPKLLLLDEPDSALDLPRRADMMAHVDAMARENGCAALIALHDPALALNSCDRVLILMDGVIACGLDMRTAGDAEIAEAMRRLYGAAAVGRIGTQWAVVGERAPTGGRQDFTRPVFS